MTAGASQTWSRVPRDVEGAKPGAELRQLARGEGMLALTWRELRRNPGAVMGIVILAAIVVVAILAPRVAPYDPIALSPADSSQGPSAQHWMGTDVLGRDIFSRVIYGARISLWLGLVSVGIASVLGLTLGLIAGYFGGWMETVIMRGADMMLAFPSFLLALTILFALGQSIINVMIAVGLASVPGYTRIVRGSVLSAREMEYVTAARTSGCSDGRLIRRHILPNVIAPVIVIASVGIAWAIITAASLSFLGMGVQPPTPEWGSMVNEGMRHLRRAWWMSSFPAMAIVVTVLAINLVGDGLRDALDPKLRNIQ
jgi:peptide/nickel transport system permease protein